MKKSIITITSCLFIAILIVGFFFMPQKIYITVSNVQHTVSLNDTYSMPNYSACIGKKYFKNLFACTDITSNIKVENDIDTSKVGKYLITISAEEAKLTENKKYVVYVKDNNAPILNLKGSNPSYVCPNKKYIEEGYYAIDDSDGDISSNVLIDRNSSTIIYMVSDESSNEVRVVRNLIFEDISKPTITLSGDETINLYLNEEYIELGYSANDNCDDDLTGSVLITGEVDSHNVGTYVINYFVSDSSGNDYATKRTVNVIKRTDGESSSTLINPSGVNTKTIYLTFDDGPGVATESLLDVLKKYNVKATFFVTAQFPKYLHLIKREYEEGHSVGLHTYSHVWNKVYGSDELYFADLQKISDVVKEQTGGYESKLIRFPGGTSNAKANYRCKGLMSRLTVEVVNRGYQYFDWNVASGDADGKKLTTKNVAQNIINGISGKKSYYIVLQHDYKQFSVDAVEEVIKYGLEHGYKFDSLKVDSPTIQFKPRG